MERTVDLNCDMGESFGAYTIGNDEAIMDYISSCNIACGFHAGDPSIMRRTVNLALQKGVAIGAHPGFPDLAGFGRRALAVSVQETYDMTLYQIGALNAFVVAEGGSLHHVKPHGALYNEAAKNPALADAVAQAVHDFDPALLLYGLAGSELIRAGERTGLRTAAEAFCDRSYEADGALTPRNVPGSLIENPADAVAQVLAIVQHHKTVSRQGHELPLLADTFCLHGDGKGALIFAEQLSQALKEEGVSITAPL